MSRILKTGNGFPVWQFWSILGKLYAHEQKDCPFLERIFLTRIILLCSILALIYVL